jgi:hypothetical protein
MDLPVMTRSASMGHYTRGHIGVLMKGLDTMIKGRYVGLVIIDFCLDDKVTDAMVNINKMVKQCLQEEFGENAAVDVEQQYADLYQCK